MLTSIKSLIKELAKNAVLIAEKELGSGKGQQKKQMAISYVLEHLPFSGFSKSLISIFLSKFIDDVIESLVIKLNNLPELKGE